MEAFKFNAKPNWHLFAGNEPITGYDGGDMEEATTRLTQYLEMIERQPTKQVYTLRTYPDSTTNITNKTAYSGSINLMLARDADIVSDPKTGLMILDRGGNQRPSAASSELMTRLDKLEETNRQLLQDLHRSEMKALQDNFANQIAGLQKKDEEKDWVTRIGESFADHPERIDRLAETVGNIFSRIFQKKENFIQQRPAQSTVHGTEQTSPAMPDTTTQTRPAETAVKLSEEGAYMHTFLTEEERKEKKAKRYELMHQRLSKIDPENRDADGQNEFDREQIICIQLLEPRLGAVILTQLLLNLAAMNDDDLNDVVNHMK